MKKVQVSKTDFIAALVKSKEAEMKGRVGSVACCRTTCKASL